MCSACFVLSNISILRLQICVGLKIPSWGFLEVRSLKLEESWLFWFVCNAFLLKPIHAFRAGFSRMSSSLTSSFWVRLLNISIYILEFKYHSMNYWKGGGRLCMKYCLDTVLCMPSSIWRIVEGSWRRQHENIEVQCL